MCVSSLLQAVSPRNVFIDLGLGDSGNGVLLGAEHGGRSADSLGEGLGHGLVLGALLRLLRLVHLPFCHDALSVSPRRAVLVVSREELRLLDGRKFDDRGSTSGVAGKKGAVAKVQLPRELSTELSEAWDVYPRGLQPLAVHRIRLFQASYLPVQTVHLPVRDRVGNGKEEDEEEGVSLPRTESEDSWHSSLREPTTSLHGSDASGEFSETQHLSGPAWSPPSHTTLSSSVSRVSSNHLGLLRR